MKNKVKHICNGKDIEHSLSPYAINCMFKKLLTYKLIEVNKEKYGYNFVLTKYPERYK